MNDTATKALPKNLPEPTVYPDRETWLHGRAKGIGASDVATILGVNPYASPYSLWTEKTERVESDDNQSLPARIGLMMEPILDELYTDETGRLLVNPGDYTVYQHPEFDFLRCTPDRLHLDDGPIEGTPLELKTLGQFTANEYTDGGQGPLSHQAQLQVQIAILGVDGGSLAALIGNREFKTYDFDRNEKFIAWMIPKLVEFWECVQSGNEPNIDHLAATKTAIAAMHPQDNGATIMANQEIARRMMELEALKKEKKTLANAMAECQNNVTAFIGDNTNLEGPEFRYTYKTQSRKGSIKVDTEHESLLMEAGIPFTVSGCSTFRTLRKAKL